MNIEPCSKTFPICEKKKNSLTRTKVSLIKVKNKTDNSKFLIFSKYLKKKSYEALNIKKYFDVSNLNTVSKKHKRVSKLYF